MIDGIGYICTSMEGVRIDFEKVDGGYVVAVNGNSGVFHSTRDEAWTAVFDSAPNADFVTAKVVMNGLEIPAMDRLVVLVKSLF